MKTNVTSTESWDFFHTPQHGFCKYNGIKTPTKILSRVAFILLWNVSIIINIKKIINSEEEEEDDDVVK